MKRIPILLFATLILLTPLEGNSDSLGESSNQTHHQHANAFLKRKLSEMDKLGLQGLLTIGKVIKEDIRYSTDDNNQDVKIETHHIEYEGMAIETKLLSGGGFDQFYVTDVLITSPKWPVQDNLFVGSTRQQVENTFGSSAKIRIRGHKNDWTYIDGLWWFSFTFNDVDKVTSIEWHRDED
jgi:hypothetical protein